MKAARDAFRAGCLLGLFFAPVLALAIVAAIVATAVGRWVVGA